MTDQGTTVVCQSSKEYPNPVWQLVGNKWYVVGYTYVDQVRKLRMKCLEIQRSRYCFAISHTRRQL